MNHPYLIMEIEIAKGSHISYIVRLTELFGCSTSFDDKYRSEMSKLRIQSGL